MPPAARSCSKGDGLPAAKGRQVCGWHVLIKAPLDAQESAAAWRLARAPLPHRPRVSKELWPPSARWCAGCQSFVPEFYCRGSRCLACHRRAARASHVERTYDITGDEEAALRAWQGGRCFICGRRALTRQLATDHDHESGAVRGMLCSDDKFGCNVALRRLLGDVEAARRLLAYVERSPLSRMRDGDPPWRYVETPERDDVGPAPF